MTEPRDKVAEMIVGRWHSRILYSGVELGVFDALADGPRTAAVLAEKLGLDPALLYRLTRAMGCLGLLAEAADGAFSLTEAGALLCADHPQTLRGVALLEESPEHYALWKHLPDMVRDGRQNAFMREFAAMAFDYAAQTPAYAEAFNAAMNSYSSAQSAWVLEALDGYDFASVSHLCDIGGGHGHMLASVLAKYPHLRGTVLEQAAVIADKSLLWAEKLGVGDRCAYLAGDMFHEVPGADAYIMKMILHDWNDDECVRILDNIHGAAGDGGRLFIVEHVVPGPDEPHFAKLFDIHMMCWGTGRERTSEEYAALLERAGWSYARTWYPPSRAMGAVEGVKG